MHRDRASVNSNGEQMISSVAAEKRAHDSADNIQRTVEGLMNKGGSILTSLYEQRERFKVEHIYRAKLADRIIQMQSTYWRLVLTCVVLCCGDFSRECKGKSSTSSTLLD